MHPGRGRSSHMGGHGPPIRGRGQGHMRGHPPPHPGGGFEAPMTRAARRQSEEDMLPPAKRLRHFKH